VLTFDTLTVMAGEEKRQHGPEKAHHLYAQALELCERKLGELGWKHLAQGLANKACCLGGMGPQEAMPARELMDRALKLYEANIEKMDSSSYYSWVTLRCNKASLLSQTHPDLTGVIGVAGYFRFWNRDIIAIKEYQETLKLFKYFPHQRLEETCRINLNNLDVPQPELDHRLFNSECPICMEPLGESKFILKCRHAYHRNCLSPCRDCPLCRS